MDVLPNRRAQSARTKAASARRTSVLMLLLAALFWGSGNVANKTVLQDLDPVAAVTARTLVAFLVLLPFALKELITVPCLGRWTKSALVPSAFFAVAIILQQWGYRSTSVTNASFLVNTSSVLTPVIGFIVLRERLTSAIVFAAVLTLLGAFLMSGAGRSLSLVNVGDVACLGSAAFYAGWMVTLSWHATSHGRPMATVCLHCLLTFILSAIALMIWLPPQPGTLSGAMPEILYLGLFSTAVAFGLTAAAQARVSASCTAVLLSAESLFGAAGGIVMLQERPEASALMGAALMLIAILIVARAPASPAGRLTTIP